MLRILRPLALSILLLSTHTPVGSEPAESTACTATGPYSTQTKPDQTIHPETLPIATVNGVNVSIEKFNRLYEARASKYRTGAPNVLPMVALGIKSAIAARLIDEALIEQEGKARAITASDSDVQSALKKFESSFPSADAFTKYVSSVAGGDEALREQIRSNVLREKLAGINPNEPVSDAEARAFYEQNNSQFNIPAHLTVQNIVFRVGAKAAPDIDYAQKVKAERALELARNPNVSFASVAQQQSESPRAKAGGDLGRVTQESIDPLLWSELARMEAGQISGVVRAADGYHILKLLRRNPEVRKSFEQARDEIKTNIRLRHNSARLTKLMTALRAKANIENHFLRRNPQADPRHFQTKPGAARATGPNPPVNPSVLLRPGPPAGTTTARPNPD